MKFACSSLVNISVYGIWSLRTICFLVEHDKPSIYLGGEFSLLPYYRVGMTAEAVGRLVEIDVMMSAIQSPESANPSRTAPNNSYLLPRNPPVS